MAGSDRPGHRRSPHHDRRGPAEIVVSTLRVLTCGTRSVPATNVNSISTHHSNRRGLTLLEVLLSIAIFGGALVAIGELIRIGSQCAATARDLTEEIGR